MFRTSLGLSGHMWDVTRDTIVSRIAYVSPVWWRMLDEGNGQHLQALLTQIMKHGLLPSTHPSIMELCDVADSKLFAEIMKTPHHVFNHLLSEIQYTTCVGAPTME